MTFIIIHPSANLERIRESLEITLRDIELRLERDKSYSDIGTGTKQEKDRSGKEA